MVIVLSSGVNEAISHAEKHLANNISVTKKKLFFLCLKQHVLENVNKKLIKNEGKNEINAVKMNPLVKLKLYFRWKCSFSYFKTSTVFSVWTSRCFSS